MRDSAYNFEDEGKTNPELAREIMTEASRMYELADMDYLEVAARSINEVAEMCFEDN